MSLDEFETLYDEEESSLLLRRSRKAKDNAPTSCKRTTQIDLTELEDLQELDNSELKKVAKSFADKFLPPGYCDHVKMNNPNVDELDYKRLLFTAIPSPETLDYWDLRNPPACGTFPESIEIYRYEDGEGECHFAVDFTHCTIVAGDIVSKCKVMSPWLFQLEYNNNEVGHIIQDSLHCSELPPTRFFQSDFIHPACEVQIRNHDGRVLEVSTDIEKSATTPENYEVDSGLFWQTD